MSSNYALRIKNIRRLAMFDSSTFVTERRLLTLHKTFPLWWGSIFLLQERFVNFLPLISFFRMAEWAKDNYNPFIQQGDLEWDDQCAECICNYCWWVVIALNNSSINAAIWCVYLISHPRIQYHGIYAQMGNKGWVGCSTQLKKATHLI